MFYNCSPSIGFYLGSSCCARASWPPFRALKTESDLPKTSPIRYSSLDSNWHKLGNTVCCMKEEHSKPDLVS